MDQGDQSISYFNHIYMKDSKLFFLQQATRPYYHMEYHKVLYPAHVFPKLQKKYFWSNQTLANRF